MLGDDFRRMKYEAIMQRAFGGNWQEAFDQEYEALKKLVIDEAKEQISSDSDVVAIDARSDSYRRLRENHSLHKRKSCQNALCARFKYEDNLDIQFVNNENEHLLGIRVSMPSVPDYLP